MRRAFEVIWDIKIYLMSGDQKLLAFFSLPKKSLSWDMIAVYKYFTVEEQTTEREENLFWTKDCTEVRVNG